MQPLCGIRGCLGSPVTVKHGEVSTWRQLGTLSADVPYGDPVLHVITAPHGCCAAGFQSKFVLCRPNRGVLSRLEPMCRGVTNLLDLHGTPDDRVWVRNRQFRLDPRLSQFLSFGLLLLFLLKQRLVKSIFVELCNGFSLVLVSILLLLRQRILVRRGT